MAINVSFAGSTIYRPGAYSKIEIDLSGGFPLGPTGLIAIFGESTKGRPGSVESDISKNVFTGNQLAEAREKYGEGNLVDSLSLLFAPASDGAIPGGAQAVYIYKTNNSTRATLSLDNSYGTVKSLEYGIGGNTITYGASEVPEVAPSISSVFDESALVGGTIKIQLNGGVAATQVVAVGVDNATFVADVGTWSVAGVTFTAGGVDGASTLEIKMDADASANQNGYGKAMELRESVGTALAEMGISVGLVSSSIESAMVLTVTS